MLERDERAAEAKELLHNPLLQTILGQLEVEAREMMLNAEPGSPVAVAYHQRSDGDPRHQCRPDPSGR